MTSPVQAALDARKAKDAEAAKIAADTAQNKPAVTDGAGTNGVTNLSNVAQGPETGVAAVTPAAAGPQTSAARQGTKQEAKEAAVAKLKDARTYMHIFAGAGTNMPNGKRLNFNGRPGGQGYYTTTKQDEIGYLEDLADSAGSQVSRDERELLIDNSLQAEQRQAYSDSTVNSARQLDAGVVAAQDNLGRTIAATSGL